jgi:hypothetical protein
VVTDCPANSPDVSPIDVLCMMLKKLVRRMRQQTFQELKSALPGAKSLIPQDTVDRLCKG